jgi:inorganic pyrophosphatase
MSSAVQYKTRIIGAPNTLEHKTYFEDAAGKIVSPFHDIPLYADASKKILNMIVEIPRWTNAKMEVCHTHPDGAKKSKCETKP